MNLEEFEAICEKATPGPWTVDDAFPVLEIMHPSKVGIPAVGIRVASGNNANFIAACRTMVPRMIKALKLVKAERNEIRLAEEGVNGGFGIVDAVEATNAAFAELEKP